MKCQRIMFHARVGPLCISEKSHRHMLHQTCAFASVGINESRTMVLCVQGT
jgi:hypothetical protein